MLNCSAGTLKSLDRDFVVKINRHFLSPTDFEGLVVKRDEQGYLTRLGDVARVELGADEHRKAFNGNGVPMVGVGIVKQSVSNTLAVAEAVRVEAEKIRKNLARQHKSAFQLRQLSLHRPRYL